MKETASVRSAIRSLLARHGCLTARELAVPLELSRCTVARTLRAMRRVGAARVVGQHGGAPLWGLDETPARRTP